MTRGFLAAPLAILLLGCPGKPPAPTPPAPSPSPTVEPTASPTVAPDPCPPVDQALVQLRCGRFGDWREGEQWDCSPIYFGQPILPEGDPARARCDLAAVGGAVPRYVLEDGTGDLRIEPRTDQQGVVRPFRFALYGHGTARLRCFVTDGHDACRGRAVTR